METSVSLIPSETLTSRFTPPNLPNLAPTFRRSTTKLQKHSIRLNNKRMKPMRLAADRRPSPSSSSSRTFAIPTIRAGPYPMLQRMATSHAKFHEEDEKITTSTRAPMSASNGDEEESNENFANTVNAVLADFVDGQNYLKETGRTTPRPMKRRALIVCLALGGIRSHADNILDNVYRIPNLRRNSSSNFARTWQLASQVSFGASKHVSAQTDTTPRDQSTDTII